MPVGLGVLGSSLPAFTDGDPGVSSQLTHSSSRQPAHPEGSVLSHVLAAGLVGPPGTLGQVLSAVDTAVYVSGVLGQILGYRY